ncbi:MAG: sigma-70 family RNA polymerase sigma factor [Pirellula sp.]|nr:sigma-70 family RNA polymerase sigma factor [Pirellula sp.]
MSEATSTSDLISEGRALVRSIALRIYRNLPMRVELDDLIAYGELGLAEAARDFEPEQGNQFSTFAYYRIRGSIYDGIAKMTWTSRARYRRMRYEQMAHEVLQSENEKPNASDGVAENGKWFTQATERLAMVYLACDCDNDTDAVQTALDPGAEASSRIIHREASETLKRLVAGLPEDERRFINYVYFEGLTLQDAGSRLGYSKSWASRMHVKILEKLAGDIRRLDMHD